MFVDINVQVLRVTIFFVGFVTDGEFNSLGTMGSERPISLLQLISDSRKMARSMRVTQIERYFTLDAHGKPMHFNLYLS